MPPTPAEMLATEQLDFFTRAFLAAITGALACAGPETAPKVVATAVDIAELTVEACHVWKSEVGERADITKRALLAAIGGTARGLLTPKDVVARAVEIADLSVRAHAIYRRSIAGR